MARCFGTCRAVSHPLRSADPPRLSPDRLTILVHPARLAPLDPHPTQSPGPDQQGWFQTTHWSVVLTAKDAYSPRSQEAMEKLCRAYWQPLYAFIRREGYPPAQAQDLTQDFFARLLTKDYLQHLRHREGRFRSFLLTFLKHFLADERDRAGAKKRGGGSRLISLDELTSEERSLMEPREALTPDQIFERRWAQAVIDRALIRLREEYAQQGREELFEQLKDIQPGQHGEVSYAELASRMNVAEGTIKSAVHRLRRRHREILREEIAQTVSSSEEIEDEIRNLLAVLSKC